MSAQTIWNVLYGKWVVANPTSLRIYEASRMGKDISKMFSTSALVQTLTRRELLLRLRDKPFTEIWGYVNELSSSLKLLKKYKEVSRKKPLTY